MARRERSTDPESPWGLVGAGAIVALVGAAILAAGTAWLGLAFLWLAGVLTTAGAVGVGVTIGLLRADHLRTRDHQS